MRDAASLVPSTDSAVLSQVRCQAHWGQPEHHRLSLNPGWCLLIKNIGGKKKSPQLSPWVADLLLEISPPWERGGQVSGSESRAPLHPAGRWAAMGEGRLCTS